jgi:PKD repeat protein
MNSERAGVYTGLAVLAVGVALLLISFGLAYGLARDPAGYIAHEDSKFSPSASSLTASFTWGSNDYTVTVTDTSVDNGSTIQSWVWGFGDGTMFSGASPPSHTYTTTCTSCVENVTLTVTDSAGHQSTAIAAVVVQKTGTSGGVAEPSFSLSSLLSGFTLGSIIGPFASTILLLVALGVMIAVGAALTKAGWNLIRPPPESVKIRVRPRSLLKEWEFTPEAGSPAVAGGAFVPGPGSPPPSPGVGPGGSPPSGPP